MLTIYGNYAFPGASRLLASTGMEDYETERVYYRTLGIGGYDFIFGITFLLSPVALLMKQRIKVPLFWLVMLVLLISTVFFGAYTISIVLSIFLILIAFSTNGKNPKKSLFWIFLFISLFIIFKDIIPIALDSISKLIDSDALKDRAYMLRINDFEYESGRESRITLYHNALLNIFDRPFLGKLEGAINITRRSGHSGLLEIFENYGVMGFLYIWYFVMVYKRTLKSYQMPSMQLFYKCYFLIFIIFITIDPFQAAYSVGCVVFFIAPIIFLMVDDWLALKLHKLKVK